MIEEEDVHGSNRREHIFVIKISKNELRLATFSTVHLYIG